MSSSSFSLNIIFKECPHTLRFSTICCTFQCLVDILRKWFTAVLHLNCRLAIRRDLLYLNFNKMTNFLSTHPCLIFYFVVTTLLIRIFQFTPSLRLFPSLQSEQFVKFQWQRKKKACIPLVWKLSSVIIFRSFSKRFLSMVSRGQGCQANEGVIQCNHFCN